MRKTSVKNLWMGGGMAVALLALAYVMQNNPSPPKAGTKRHLAVTPAVAVSSDRADLAGDERLTQAAPDQADLTRYQVIVARNIFAPPAPKQERTANRPRARFTGIQPVVIPPVPPGSSQAELTPDSLDNWQFAGYYVTDGVTKAVLQNEAEDGYQFVAAGDRFKNYTVESVSTEDHGQVVLVCGRTRQTLKPVEDFSLVPLQGATISNPPPTANLNPNMPMYGRGPGMGPGRACGRA